MTLGANDKKWILGDLALQRIPIADREQGDYSRSDETDRLMELASSLDVKFKSLRAYRGIAKAWPEEHRRYDLPWSVHMCFRHMPDRFELINKRQWTSQQAATERRKRQE